MLDIANVVPSSLILFSLMRKEVHSSKTSVLTRATGHHITGDCNLHSHRHENLKSYKTVYVVTQLLVYSYTLDQSATIARVHLRLSAQVSQQITLELSATDPVLLLDNSKLYV
jgi:hypothetical protein